MSTTDEILTMARGFCGSIVLLLAVFVLAVESGDAQMLVTPDDVAGIMTKDNWVILDCRTKKLYDIEHIPGAIHLGDGCRSALRDATERVLPPGQLERILGGAGISRDKHVVVYADAKSLVFATVGFWILEYLGHEKVHLLDGGLDAWKSSGKNVSREQARLQPETYKAQPNPAMIASTDYVLDVVKGRVKNVQMVDSRTEREYTGREIRSLRGGHLPNTTLNVSHELLFDKNTGMLLPAGGVEKHFNSLDRNKKTILICQTGSRSTVTYIQLKRLGFRDVVNYDEGFTVYANSVYPPYPLEDEQWINLEILIKFKTDIERLHNEVAKLRKDIDEMRKMK